MAGFRKRHWLDAAMVVAGVLVYLFVVEDKRLFLALLLLIGGRNLAVWRGRDRLK